MLRIDHANHILGLRLNVFVAAAVFLAAVIYLIATRRLGREDPKLVWGIDPHARTSRSADRPEQDEGGDGDPGADADEEDAVVSGRAEGGGDGDPGADADEEDAVVSGRAEGGGDGDPEADTDAEPDVDPDGDRPAAVTTRTDTDA
jgi:hypothetical protein